MPAQSRRRASRPSRRERRAGVARPYVPVTRAPLPVAGVTTPVTFDREAEFASIRRDLFRILFWATLLIVLMIALSFMPLTEWLAAW